MKAVKLSAIALAVSLATGASAADLSAVPSGAYTADNTHTYIRLQYNHLGLSNPSLGFEKYDLSMNLDNANPANTTVNLSIDLNSVQTGSEIWHDHITGEKWFDVANNPTAKFESTGVTANADGTYDLAGDLTIKGMTKPVVMKVTVNAAMMHPMAKKPVVGISAVGGIKRSDWGLGANAPFVSDEVKLSVESELLAN